MNAAIKFQRSTTVTVIDRHVNEHTQVLTQHTAHFTICVGAIPDQHYISKRKYRNPFRPMYLEVTWRDRNIVTMKMSGPRLLRSGNLSGWDCRTATITADDLPLRVRAKLSEYETRQFNVIRSQTS